jgi:hypothetical protein
MKSTTYRRNGATLNIPVGFSWTTFVFGWWPSVIRGQWRLAWTFLGVDVVAIWMTTVAFQGDDFLLAPVILRGVCAYFRNAELHEDVQKDGWKTEAMLFAVQPEHDDGASQ